MIRSFLLTSLTLLAATPLSAQTVLYEIQLDTAIGMYAGGLRPYLELVEGDDLDGDGVPDLLIGSPVGFYDLEARSGRSGARLWRVDGGEDQFARSLALVGDLDGDSVREVLVGSTGGPRLLDGASGALLWHMPTDWITQLGFSVATLGDVDGDSLPEWVIGAPQYLAMGGGDHYTILNNGHGSACVFPGTGSGDMLHRSTPPGPYTYGYGGSVAGLGDVNGDGVGDYAATSFYPLVGRGDAVAVHSGVDGRQLYRVWADYLGTLVDGVGDLDGDGVGDFTASTPQCGYVRVYSGATGSLLHFLRTPAYNDFFGYSLASVGDQNGDGTVDLLIGAPQQYWMPFYTGAGFALLVSGATGQVIHRFDGAQEGEHLGVGVGSLGDLNGDGRRELLVGSAKRGWPHRERAVIQVISL
jgi:hypothetical protein